jgi:hypothetical protein
MMIGTKGRVRIYRSSEAWLQLQLVGHDQDHTRLVNARDRLFRQRNAIEIALGRHLPKHVIRELEAREGIGLRNYPDAG